ncbi:ABC transporter ATP-binding protein [Synechococcus sp. BA-132 BA5]|uniref:ABC transporter ATP-binding protein n=1 Tax=Synechococcus sp. BA-132 BA5 TaxID=3110252 RepID=UPI002B21FBCC|nr:ABC transporter ATP-binding protein [Synechococcus sp. BA-132 BA5]MEA5415060.1 ABC transporter ATP-binding protein [Synechococcus sp. BA-132 BA5]
MQRLLQFPAAGPRALWIALVREAGLRQVGTQVGLTLIVSLLDVGGLGVAIRLLLGNSGSATMPLHVSLPILFVLVVGRSALQGLASVRQEQLQNGFSDRLRHDLLALVLAAPANQVQTVGRGDLLGLLVSDISRSTLALDQGVRALQNLIALCIYGLGVLVVARSAALPLVLGLGAAATAALLRRSGAWQLGRLQTQLNGAIQRTVGDGLHGLKAVRAAGAEPWLLERFARETEQVRQVLQRTVRRQASYTVLRDGLALAVLGLWLWLVQSSLTPEAVATTLLLVYRAASSLGTVISNLRYGLGALPGYGELCRLRQRLRAPAADPHPTRLPASNADEPAPQPLLRVCWHDPQLAVDLARGRLTAVAGPSGSGKTTLLDGFAGLLGEERSCWELHGPAGASVWEGRAGARSWRQLVAYAPQDPVLFEGSLRDNLLLQRSGSGQWTDGALKVWLERLDLVHLLARPEGLDGRLHLSLDCFSGGEIRRLVLLRTWLIDRPVEVLDEPTASLDPGSATLVRQIIRERCRERLVLVASHDKELLAMADRTIRRSLCDRDQARALHD